MFTFIYTLLTIFVFSVIGLSLYFKFKDLKKRDKKKEDKPTKRLWWHYILFFIVGIISLFVGIMFVRFIFGAPPF